LEDFIFSEVKYVRKGDKMLVGLMADTHDFLPMVDKAVERLNEEGVKLVLHAGDYVAPFVVPRFKKLKAKLIGVFGNNDGDRELLKKRFSEYEGLEMRGNFAEIVIDGAKIVLLHGSEEELLKVLINSEIFDIVVHGHTHKAEAYRKEKTLVVNPGEVCGYLTGRSTIALLETSKREAKIVEI
jgi:putative phosphoesterase